LLTLLWPLTAILGRISASWARYQTVLNPARRDYPSAARLRKKRLAAISIVSKLLLLPSLHTPHQARHHLLTFAGTLVHSLSTLTSCPQLLP